MFIWIFLFTFAVRKLIKNKKTMTIEDIKREYHDNDVCMFDLLATTSADGLTLEEAFELYIESMKWSDDDKFYRKVEDEMIEL